MNASVLRPRKLKEALSMLDGEAELEPLAGGTDLFVALNAHSLRAKKFIDLWSLHELRGIERDGRQLEFGALTTYSDCIESKKVNKLLPMLVAAAREVGGVQIQNRGTLGGNIGNGSPAGDSLPIFAACDTTLVLESIKGEREVPWADFYTGYRKTVRRADEIITRVRVEVPPGEQYFRKVGTRAAQAISKVVMAAVGSRTAWGSVAPTVVRAHKLERYLETGGCDVEEAQALLAQEIRPIDDIRSTADYRRRVSGNLIGNYMQLLRSDRGCVVAPPG